MLSCQFSFYCLTGDIVINFCKLARYCLATDYRSATIQPKTSNIIMAQRGTYFAPQLYIQAGMYDTSFYEKAFNAVELRRFTNEDGSIHVAELSIDGCVFQVHEEKPGTGRLSPKGVAGTTVLVGLFVPDVDKIMAQALDAGAVLVTPAQDYDYGYHQAELRDPFGHTWMIEQTI